MKKRNNKGFTLIELLIVVAIIGIIVAIAIPNLLNAIQRAKQKRTMADMRSAGTAAEAYAVDFNHYPAAAAITLPSGFSAIPTSSFGVPGKPGVQQRVAPTYIRVLPLVDGWSSFFLYGTAPTSSTTRSRPLAKTAHPRPLHRRRDDELQRRHRLRRRPVPPVPRGRTKLIVLPLSSDPRAPSRGSFLFRA